MGGAFAFPADGDHVTFNDPDIQAAEIPGANGMSRRTVAGQALRRLCLADQTDFGCCPPTSVEDALVERSNGRQRFGGADRGERWGTGFLIASPPHTPCSARGASVTPALAGNSPSRTTEHGVGFAYINNQMGGTPDDRARAARRGS